MIDATSAGLAEVAGLQLYRRNAFRLTGLPSGADRRTVRRRRHQVVAALRVGADVDLGHGPAVEPAAVAAAFDRILGDQRRRLVDELFWVWGEPDGCPCAPKLHHEHDEAVRAHSRVLDLELAEELTDEQLDQVEDLWIEAARCWTATVRRAAFWDHVRYRIVELDDRQLDESVVDVLREEVPVVLVKPMIELATGSHEDPAWLVDQLMKWPVPAHRADDLLEAAAAPSYEALETALRDAADRLDAGAPKNAVGALVKRAVPTLDSLETLVPHTRHRRTATLRDRAAVLYNNCANALVDELGAGAEKHARSWLRRASELAVDPSTRSTVEENHHELMEVVRVLATIQSQVAYLTSMGRHRQAEAMLRRVRQLAGGGTGTTAIDRMITDLALGRRIAPARTSMPVAPSRSGAGAWGRVVVVVVILAVALLIVLLASGCGAPTGPGPA